MERQRRLHSICFNAFIEEGAKDPIGAPWLPLEIFQFNHDPDRKQIESAPASKDSLLNKVQSSCPDEMNWSDEEAKNNPLRAPPHDRFTTAGEATHGVAESIINIENISDVDDPLVAKMAESSSSPSSKNFKPAPTTNLTPPAVAKSDRQMLQHGSMPGPLGAHWSDYYSTNLRTPQVTTLAPWVARVYKRRRQRQKDKEDNEKAKASVEASPNTL